MIFPCAAYQSSHRPVRRRLSHDDCHGLAARPPPRSVLVAQSHVALCGPARLGSCLGQHRGITEEIIGVMQRDDILTQHVVRGIAQAIAHGGVGEAAAMFGGQNKNHVGGVGDKSTGQALAPDELRGRRANPRIWL